MHRTVQCLPGRRHVRAAAIIILAAGCRGSDWQNAVDDVIAAERAFAARATDTTVQQAFLESIANDAVLFRPGPTDARALLATQPYPPDFQLEWTPEWADASLDGELGYTMGPWRAGRRNQSSQPGAYGTYVTIWKRTPRDGWRVILDFGTGGASAFAARELRHRRVRRLTRMPQTVVHSNSRFASSTKISLKPLASIAVLSVRSFPMTHAFCAMDPPLR
jgi:ketosteroid isomerase-like protein